MSVLALIIAIVALFLAIISFKRTGGIKELQDQVNSFDSIASSLRDKTASALQKMEKALRRTDKEGKPEKKEEETADSESDK
ncbi:MAG: hypothetical protein ABID54_02510 [Pseudomonadota bacterium]